MDALIGTIVRFWLRCLIPIRQCIQHIISRRITVIPQWWPARRSKPPTGNVPVSAWVAALARTGLEHHCLAAQLQLAKALQLRPLARRAARSARVRPVLSLHSAEVSSVPARRNSDAGACAVGVSEPRCDQSTPAARAPERLTSAFVCGAVYAKNIATTACYIRHTARFALNFALQNGSKRRQQPPQRVKLAVSGYFFMTNRAVSPMRYAGAAIV
jgi:hypothetical protein